jgi:hypothetical protein
MSGSEFLSGKATMTMRRALLLFLAIAPGCTIYTVESESGTKSLPADLRSSADVYRPSVGAPNIPTTQPGVMGTVDQTWNNLVYDLPKKFMEMVQQEKFLDAAMHLKPGTGDADMRRTALNRIATNSRGKSLPYTDVYRATALQDPDGPVRAAAVRAINHVRDEQSTAALVVALGDTDPMVRQEAAKALANLPTTAAEAPLRALVQKSDEDVDTRIAAVDALRHYRSAETQRLLISQLNSNNFALAWQARRSLYLQTGTDFRYDEPAWLSYIASAQQ